MNIYHIYKHAYIYAYITKYTFAIIILNKPLCVILINKKTNILYFAFTYSSFDVLYVDLTYANFLLSKKLLLTCIAKQVYW